MSAVIPSSRIAVSDGLYSITSKAIEEASELLNFSPLIVWGRQQGAEKPSQAKTWFYINNEISSDRQIALGRPKRHRIEGTLTVTAYYPKKPEQNIEIVERCMSCLQTNYRKQRALQGLFFLDLPVSPQAPEGGWNRVAMAAEYRVDYIN